MLPTGLTLDSSTGAVSGTPTAAGPFTASIQVRDANGQTFTLQVVFSIVAPPVLSGSPPSGEQGVAFGPWTPTLTGGVAPFTWSVVA